MSEVIFSNTLILH